MKIIVDAFGGDNAPLEIIKGCIEARKEFGVDIMLTGDRDKIEKCAKDNSLDISPFEIKQADAVFEMTTPPTEILKSKRGTSLGVGLDALAFGRQYRCYFGRRHAHSQKNKGRKASCFGCCYAYKCRSVYTCRYRSKC